MDGIFKINYLYEFLIFTNLFIYFLVFFFFVNFTLFLIIFSTYLWQKIVYGINVILFYFFNIVFFLLLFFLCKIYINFLYNIYYPISCEISTKILPFLFFSDTLICLALFITAISWVYLGERYLANSLFFLMYFFIFIICTIGMTYTNNLLIMFIFFEFIFLPSLFFVYKFGYSHKVEKTISYLLLWTMTGSVLVLFGVCYIFIINKTLDINTLIYLKFSDYETYFLFFLFFFGFGVKIPLWPFHYWLTKVHVEAPTGFSIFLSGFLVKTAFYCFVTFYHLFITTVAKDIALGFIIWGAVDASLRMWSVTDIKRLIAFATIQEMNLIILFFILLGNNNYIILNLFLLVHGVLSGFLFFLVEQIQKQFLTRQLLGISGVANSMPSLHFMIWIAILIFRGFPMFIKFFIEYELLNLLILNFSILGIIYFFIISFFGTLGFVRIWFSMLYGQPSKSLRNSFLKKDLIISFFFIFFLFFLQFFIFLF